MNSTQQPNIDEQEAIRLAEQTATTSEFHFIGSREKLTDIRAELITLKDAYGMLLAEKYGFGYDHYYEKELIVWIVWMDGTWPKEYPPLLPGEPTREPTSHLAVILDANSGKVITVAGRD